MKQQNLLSKAPKCQLPLFTSGCVASRGRDSLLALDDAEDDEDDEEDDEQHGEEDEHDLPVLELLTVALARTARCGASRVTPHVRRGPYHSSGQGHAARQARATAHACASRPNLTGVQ